MYAWENKDEKEIRSAGEEWLLVLLKRSEKASLKRIFLGAKVWNSSNNPTIYYAFQSFVLCPSSELLIKMDDFPPFFLGLFPPLDCKFN